MINVDWPLIKEWCGLLGALCATAPWLRDFRYRVSAENRSKVQAKGAAERWLKAINANDQSWLSAPKATDLLLTIGGLLLLATSFAIGVCIAP